MCNFTSHWKQRDCLGKNYTAAADLTKVLFFSIPVADACESALIVQDTQAQPIKPTVPTVHLEPWPISAMAKMISPGFLFSYKPSAPPLALPANLEDSVNEDTSTVQVSHHVDLVVEA